MSKNNVNFHESFIYYVADYIENSIKYAIDHGLKKLCSQSIFEDCRACPFACIDLKYEGKGRLIGGIDKFVSYMQSLKNINLSKYVLTNIACSIIHGFDSHIMQHNYVNDYSQFYELGVSIYEKYGNKNLQDAGNQVF